MEARSTDDELRFIPRPAAPYSPVGYSRSTHSQKRAQVEILLASYPEGYFDTFRLHLQHAFSALKLQHKDRDILSQLWITMWQKTIHSYLEAIVSSLSEFGPGRLPDWLAERIFITPSLDRRPIFPARELFYRYHDWCTSHEVFDFYSALTQLLKVGLFEFTSDWKSINKKKYATYARSFASNLRGDVVQCFNDALLSDYEAKFDPTSYYGRIIPIVQSSGTGKSRLVHEMRKIWPTLSVTLSMKPKDPVGGFPIQDVGAFEYFRRQTYRNDRDLIAIAFLAAWFKVAAESLPANQPLTVEAIFDENWDHSRVDYEHTLVHNRDRKRMFNSVNSNAVLLIDYWKENHPDNDQVDCMVKELLEQPLRKFAQRVASFEAVKRQTKQYGCKKPLVLIAFDDCALLSQFRPKYNMLHLRRCFHHIGTITDLPVSVWLLLLDTDSTISQQWSAEKDYKSLREHDSLRQFPPFYAMGFDVLEQKAKAPRPCDALKLDMLKYYGRPLWHGYEAEKVLQVAYIKLSGSDAAMHPGDSREAKLSETSADSLLSNRIGLDLVPLRSDQNKGTVVTTSVQRPMRIMVDFDESGKVGTRAHSEPMLAIAAWYWLSDSRGYPRSWPNVIKFMRDHFLHSESVDGVNGEALVRLLLVLARDFTVEARKVRKLPWWNHAPDMPAIPFPSLLSALLGKSASKLVLAKLEQLDTEAKAKDALAQKHATKRKHTSPDFDVAVEEGQCWVNFTHVTPVATPLPQITSYFLWEAWKRGAAIQCARGQARIDGILPIYRGSLDDVFNEKGEAARRMTYMAWQVKNQDKGTKSTECMHGPLVAYPAKETGEPLFTLLLELEDESTFQRDAMISETHPKISVSTFECTEPSCRSRSMLRLVHVRGCEAEVYPCLEHWEAGDAFGDMVRRVSDRSIGEGKTMLDDTLMHEVDNHLCEETP